MSLKWYARPRLVALKSSTSVLDAARAIEHNNRTDLLVAMILNTTALIELLEPHHA